MGEGIAVLQGLDLLLVGEQSTIDDDAVASPLLVDGVRERLAVEALVHQPVTQVFYVDQSGLLLVDLTQLDLADLLQFYHNANFKTARLYHIKFAIKCPLFANRV